MLRHALIRDLPCPRCGSEMIWRSDVWKIRRVPLSRQTPRTAGGWASAYRCDNPVCGMVLDPVTFARAAPA
jgi:hypothetical protein